jgi:hypothetical protein
MRLKNSHTGRGLEESVLGKLKEEVRGIKRYRMVCGKKVDMKRDFLACVFVVKSTQGKRSFNPQHPKTKAIKVIYNHIASGLREKKNLYIYNSVGTELDVFHGVDFFVEYRKGKESILVTFDLTCRESKGKFKADVLMTRSVIESDTYYELADSVARKITEQVKDWEKGK